MEEQLEALAAENAEMKAQLGNLNNTIQQLPERIAAALAGTNNPSGNVHRNIVENEENDEQNDNNG